MDPDTFAEILGLVESDGNPNAKLGDGGRAFGRWQVHPDWVFEWALRLKVTPKLNELWDDFMRRLIKAFYNFPFHLKLQPIEVAMTFHIGHITHVGQPNWDDDYATRFKFYAAQQH